MGSKITRINNTRRLGENIMDTDTAPLIPCVLNTRIRAWNPGQGVGGYVQVQDVINLVLAARRDIQVIDWVGADSYPLTLTHWALTEDPMRLLIVYAKDLSLIKVLTPSNITRVYRVTWIKPSFAYATNIGDVVLSPGGGSLTITNNNADLPSLNYLGRQYQMVIL